MSDILPRMPSARLLSAVFASAAVLAAFVSVPSAGAATYPVIYNISAARGVLADHTAPPPGANDFSCQPSAAHPNPVVLVHGLGATMGENWATYAPLLANHGYCV